MEPLTRIVLFEKVLLRIKISFQDIDSCYFWYKNSYGEIFEVRNINYENWLQKGYGNTIHISRKSSEELYEVMVGGHPNGALIYKTDCKILT